MRAAKAIRAAEELILKGYFVRQLKLFAWQAVVLGGVHIGNNVVIGAGSVVTKDIPDGYLAFGNPCKPVRPNFRYCIQSSSFLLFCFRCVRP